MKSVAQRKLFALAAHDPKTLFPANKKILGNMSKDHMHNYSSTRELKPKTPSVAKVDVEKSAKLVKLKNLRLK